jgi:ParB family chromosome partitioning protein
MAEVENRLEQVLGRKVTITQGKTSGTVALEYYGADDLERLIAALENLTV